MSIQLVSERPSERFVDPSPLSIVNIVGASAALQAALARARKVAPTESSVLVTGETGTGKGFWRAPSTAGRAAPPAPS